MMPRRFKAARQSLSLWPWPLGAFTPFGRCTLTHLRKHSMICSLLKRPHLMSTSRVSDPFAYIKLGRSTRGFSPHKNSFIVVGSLRGGHNASYRFESAATWAQCDH